MIKKPLVCILCCALLSSCQGHMLPYVREIDQYEIITMLGIDKTDEEYGLIAASLREEKPVTLTNRARTLSVAFNEMQTFSDKFLYLGHAHYYLLGENAVRENLEECLDFLMHDPALRMDSKVYVVKNADARELIEKTSDEDIFITDRLVSLEKDIELLSLAKPMPIIELMQKRINTGSFIIPAVTLVDKGTHNLKDAGSPDMDVGGYAVFKEGLLAGYIDNEQAKAVSQLTGNSFMDTVEVLQNDGRYAALVIIDPIADVDITWDGEYPSAIHITMRFSTTVLEPHNGGQNIIEGLGLEQAQDELIINRIKKAVETAQMYKVDYLGFSSKANSKHPNKFAKIKDRWDEIFSGLPVTVSSVSSVERVS